MESHYYTHLLNQVNTINLHYIRINELTGENFNVFKILKVDSSEVRLHSTFLAELLNPKGSHGQNDVFLKIFIKLFCYKGHSYNTEFCNSSSELHTSFINTDGNEGGRIDIVVTDNQNHQILIENKIYARDQDKQILRYRNFNPNADLFYLTLWGKKPSKESKEGLSENKDFRCLSYSTDIIKWLEECRKEVSIYPIVRESITQYINLIKSLTNQTVNQTMEKELSNVIKSNIEASFIIANNLNHALNEILVEYAEQMKAICTRLGLKFKNSVDFEERYTGFWISRENWQYANIGFQFQNYDKELRYGICAKNSPEKLPTELREKINKIPDNTPKYNNWWAWHRMMESPLNDWSKYDAWKAVKDGTMSRSMEEKIVFLLNHLDKIKL